MFRDVFAGCLDTLLRWSVGLALLLAFCVAMLWAYVTMTGTGAVSNHVILRATAPSGEYSVLVVESDAGAFTSIVHTIVVFSHARSRASTIMKIDRGVPEPNYKVCWIDGDLNLDITTTGTVLDREGSFTIEGERHKVEYAECLEEHRPRKPMSAEEMSWLLGL